MDNYKNVDVDKLANIYFEGKVVSRNVFLKDGSKKTLGVMLPGEYEFNTESRELMEIISGKLNLKDCPSGCRYHPLNFQLHKILQK